MRVGEPQKYISITDPAVHQPAMGPVSMGRYLEFPDPKLLVYVRGQKPAVYHWRRINTQTMRKFVQKGEDQNERWDRAFLMGCTRIDNAVNVNERREPYMEPAFEQAGADGTPLKTWTDAQIAKLPACVLTDVGRVIYQHSFLARSAGVCCPAPLSLRTDLQTLLLRDAGDPEPGSDLATSSNGSPKEAEILANSTAPDSAATATADQ